MKNDGRGAELQVVLTLKNTTGGHIMEPMTLGRAIAICKSINSPDPFADVEEKREAIRTILGAATLNSMTKQDLLRVMRWMWEQRFAK